MNYLELYNIFPQFKLNMPTRRGLVEFPNLVVWHVKYRFIIIIIIITRSAADSAKNKQSRALP